MCIYFSIKFLTCKTQTINVNHNPIKLENKMIIETLDMEMKNIVIIQTLISRIIMLT